MRLVIYGSFSCPYSFLASLRADRLTSAGEVSFEWRAVVHNPDVPAEGCALIGERGEMFDRELAEIGGLLAPGESYPACRPPAEPNTTAAVAGYASLDGEAADQLRAGLFEALWVEGSDIGKRTVLDRLGCPPNSHGTRMQAWQHEWEATERPVVPMMVLPDGTIFSGLGALSRLAQMSASSPLGTGMGSKETAAGPVEDRSASPRPEESLEGGDPSCWAHLTCPECGRMLSEGHDPVCASERVSLSRSSRRGD